MTNGEWAMKMIPVLVYWARESWEIPHTYKDLCLAVGYKSYRMGGVLGCIKSMERHVLFAVSTLRKCMVNLERALSTFTILCRFILLGRNTPSIRRKTSYPSVPTVMPCFIAVVMQMHDLLKN